VLGLLSLLNAQMSWVLHHFDGFVFLILNCLINHSDIYYGKILFYSTKWS
jgi:hypothetical protein